MMICITGAGGKTSLLYALADRAAAAGKRVVVSTTTHIFQPAEEYAYDRIEVLKLWKQGRFAVVGTPCEGGKLKSPSEEELAFWDEYADLLLLEADGSKHLPLKVPASHEPVVPAACRCLVGVMGMDAWKNSLQDACFRPQLACALLQQGPEHEISLEDMAFLGSSPLGLAKESEGRRFSVVLNKCEGSLIPAAEDLRQLLQRRGIERVVLTAEGRPLAGEEKVYDALLD